MPENNNVVQLPYQNPYEPRDKFWLRLERWREARGWETRPLPIPAPRERGAIASRQEQMMMGLPHLPLFAPRSCDVLPWPATKAATTDDRKTA